VQPRGGDVERGQEEQAVQDGEGSRCGQPDRDQGRRESGVEDEVPRLAGPWQVARCEPGREVDVFRPVINDARRGGRSERQPAATDGRITGPETGTSGLGAAIPGLQSPRRGTGCT